MVDSVLRMMLYPRHRAGPGGPRRRGRGGCGAGPSSQPAARAGGASAQGGAFDAQAAGGVRGARRRGADEGGQERAPSPRSRKRDKAFLELKQHPNPEVGKLVDIRLAVYRATSRPHAPPRCKACPCADRGRLQLNLGTTITGRLSGAGGVNPQNLPRKGGLRNALTAPAGHSFIVADLSKIEVCVGARITECKPLMEETSTADGEPYCRTISAMLGRTITKEDDAERQLGQNHAAPDPVRRGRPGVRRVVLRQRSERRHGPSRGPRSDVPHVASGVPPHLGLVRRGV